MTTKRWFPLRPSSTTSALSSTATAVVTGQLGTQHYLYMHTICTYTPCAATPYVLAGLSCLSAWEYLAADTIFIDLVIFSIFLTDFSRTDTVWAEVSLL